MACCLLKSSHINNYVVKNINNNNFIHIFLQTSDISLNESFLKMLINIYEHNKTRDLHNISFWGNEHSTYVVIRVSQDSHPDLSNNSMYVCSCDLL